MVVSRGARAPLGVGEVGESAQAITVTSVTAPNMARMRDFMVTFMGSSVWVNGCIYSPVH